MIVSIRSLMEAAAKISGTVMLVVSSVIRGGGLVGFLIAGGEVGLKGNSLKQKKIK